MTPSEQVRVLRVMAAEWLQSAVDSKKYSLPHLRKQDGEHCKARAAALTAGAEALEAMSAKQTAAAAPTAQKAEILTSLADAADALAKLDCGLTDRAGMAQRAALFRECAAMMRRHPDDALWEVWAGPVLNGFVLLVAKNGRTFHCDWHPTLEAAQAAAVAWVDGNETRNRDMERKNGKS